MAHSSNLSDARECDEEDNDSDMDDDGSESPEGDTTYNRLEPRSHTYTRLPTLGKASVVQIETSNTSTMRGPATAVTPAKALTSWNSV